MPYVVPSAAKRLVTVLLLTLARLAAPSWATTYPLPPGGGSLVGQDLSIEAEASDTLLGIAHQYSVGYWEIQSANPHVDVWLPGQGTRVIIPGRFILPPVPRRGIVINLPAHRLFYFPKPRGHDRPIVITYPPGTGIKGFVTPVGETRIIRKVPHPVWIPTRHILEYHAKMGDPIPRIFPAGPDNPMGEWALETGLSHGEIYIHGTNNPIAIGMSVSHGCLRLYPEDIAALFRIVPIGTPVNVVNDPILATLQDGKLYLSVSPPVDSGNVPAKPDYRVISKVIHQAIGNAVVAIDWDRVHRISVHATGMPELIGVQANYEPLQVRTAGTLGERTSGRLGGSTRKASRRDSRASQARL